MEIRQILQKSDIKNALEIYNSNADFLSHHLGKNKVDTNFLYTELKEMNEHSFSSNLVIFNEIPIGIIDYMQNDDGYVYLSLLMISSNFQKKD